MNMLQRMKVLLPAAALTAAIAIRCALELDGTDLDMTCYEQQIYLKSGEYAALISVSTCSEEELTELIGCFSME